MSEKYKVQYYKSYSKDLKKIPKKDQDKIQERINSLSTEPRPNGSKKLEGKKDPPLYRIRFGDYRIIYTIEDNVLLVLVIEIGHRKEIYNDF